MNRLFNIPRLLVIIKGSFRLYCETCSEVGRTLRTCAFSALTSLRNTKGMYSEIYSELTTENCYYWQRFLPVLLSLIANKETHWHAVLERNYFHFLKLTIIVIQSDISAKV
jgi:hypothetical protein